MTVELHQALLRFQEHSTSRSLGFTEGSLKQPKVWNRRTKGLGLALKSPWLFCGEQADGLGKTEGQDDYLLVDDFMGQLSLGEPESAKPSPPSQHRMQFIDRVSGKALLLRSPGCCFLPQSHCVEGKWNCPRGGSILLTRAECKQACALQGVRGALLISEVSG